MTSNIIIDFPQKCFHIKRRSDPDHEIQTKFLKEMKEVFDNVPLDHILNADETGWKLMPKGILTWGETGVDNLTRQAKINDKSQITVLATITTANTKLPLSDQAFRFYLHKLREHYDDNNPLHLVFYLSEPFS